MAFKLPDLPYAKDALAPYISAETLEFHHGKHHAAYLNRLNELIANTDNASASLEDIIRKAGPGVLFNQAAQHFNHSFYWNCLKPHGGGEPGGKLGDAIKQAFGGFEQFKKQFTDACVGQFGSGWAWLARKGDGSLAIYSTSNAETPLTRNDTPILTCDVWEHAYYIDYRNARPKYLEAFWKLVNWEHAASRMR